MLKLACMGVSYFIYIIKRFMITMLGCVMQFGYANCILLIVGSILKAPCHGNFLSKY